MENVHGILSLDAALADLALRRAAAIGRAAEWDALDSAYRAAEEEREQLLASLTPEDSQWLDVERACRRHGIGGEEDD